MELDQIIKLINTVSDSSLTGFTLEEGSMKLVFNKQVPSGEPVIEMPRVQEGNIVPSKEVKPSLEGGQEKELVCEEGIHVKSPLVGTFYHSPSPDESPFVAIGDTVKKGQTLGIVEAMKLMNEIECECDGIIEAILIKNEEMVEYGQPLFKIKNL